jgi:branched-chain amino acid transport system permease protein
LKRVKHVSFAILGLLLLTLPEYASNYVLMASITALNLSYLSQCWNLVGGYAGQLSLGHSIFYGIGAYTSTMLLMKHGVTPWVGMLAGGAFAALAALFIGGVVFRYRIRGIYFALVTIAFSEIVRGVANNLDYINSSVGFLLPLRNDPANFFFLDRRMYYYIALALVALAAGITYVIERTAMGYYLVAIRENEEAALASGVNAYRVKTTIFCISAFLTAIGGTFYAQLMLYISPDLMFGLGNTNNMLLGTMIGGTGTLFGPILGSTIFALIGEILRSISFGQGSQAVTVTSAIYGTMLIVVALYLPKGIIDIRSKFAGWKAVRRGFPFRGRGTR